MYIKEKRERKYERQFKNVEERDPRSERSSIAWS